MHSRIGQGLFALGLTLGLALCSGCQSTAPSSSAPEAPLRIGVVKDSPPLIFYENRQWMGVETELGRALAARLDRKPVFVAYPTEQLTQALLDGKVDMLMSGITITEERRIQMDFSNPYLVVGQAALIRPSDLLRYNTKIKIRSTPARIGVIEGSAADRLISRYFKRAVRVPFQNTRKAVAALKNNEIDLWMGNAPAIWWLAQQQNPPLAIAPALFAKEEVAWAFRRGSVSLRESANQAILEWQKDGTIERVLGHWLPFSK